MRRQPLPLLSLLALFAACGSQAGGTNQALGESPVNGGADTAAPPAAAPTGNEAAGLTEFRDRWLEACIGGGRDAAPPGTPVDRHCACAIDRVMAGKTLEELEADQQSGAYRSRFSAEMRACIREIPS